MSSLLPAAAPPRRPDQLPADNYDTDIESLRQQTLSGQIENQATLMSALGQAESMAQSPLLAGITGAMSGASAGAGVSTGLGL